MQIPILISKNFQFVEETRLGETLSRIIIDRKKKKRNSQECTAPEIGAEYQYEYIYNSVQTFLFPKIFNS